MPLFVRRRWGTLRLRVAPQRPTKCGAVVIATDGRDTPVSRHAALVPLVRLAEGARRRRPKCRWGW